MGFLKDGESIMYAHFPETFEALGLAKLMDDADDVLDMVEDKFQLIRAGRNLRVSYDIPPARKLNYHVKANTQEMADFLNQEMPGLLRMLNAEKVTVSLEEYHSDDGSAAPSLLVNAGLIYLPLKGVVDLEAEKAKLHKQQKELQGWMKGLEGKLKNPGFLAKAPPQLVENTKAQLAEMQEKLKRVEDALKTLG